MSLRSRLLLGLLLLVAVGLGVTAVVTYEEQRSFLLGRIDQQVVASVPPVSVTLGVVDTKLPSPRSGVVPPVSGRGASGSNPSTFQTAGTYGELLNREHTVLKRRSFSYGDTPASPPALPRTLSLSHKTLSRVRLFTVDSEAGPSLRYRVAAFPLSGGRIMVIAVPLREVDQTLGRLVVVEGLVGGGVIISLLILGWVVIRLGLRPLERIGRVAEQIADGDLSRRVTLAHERTEVGRLGLALNEMLVQIEQAFQDRTESEDRLRRFLADASHELRTPLALIRGYAELFRLGIASSPTATARSMTRIEAEATRMGTLVGDLLLLAQLDELPEIRRVPVDLTELARHAADDTRAIATTREVVLRSDGPVYLNADPDQLRQVLANLIRNALIHTPPHSPIELAVERNGVEAVLRVRDHGPGLPAGAEDRAFERFWRTEKGRARGPGGAGLGLAIVKAIVSAHRGSVHARNLRGGGAEFCVTLPIAPDTPTSSPASVFRSDARNDASTTAVLSSQTESGPPCQ